MLVASLLVHNWREAILAVAMIHCTICNKWEETLSTRRYSARLTVINQK
jgi:hypothetical protein